MIEDLKEKIASLLKITLTGAGLIGVVGIIYFATSFNDKIEDLQREQATIKAVVYGRGNDEVINYLKAIDSNYGNLKDFTMRHCNREM